jgi:hypothetical protein
MIVPWKICSLVHDPTKSLLELGDGGGKNYKSSFIIQIVKKQGKHEKVLITTTYSCDSVG